MAVEHESHCVCLFLSVGKEERGKAGTWSAENVGTEAEHADDVMNVSVGETQQGQQC